MQGRKNIIEKLKVDIPKNEKIIWVHCSSLGEFEQGRPVIEKLKSQYANFKFLLTFFSPSGYEVRKDYPGADWVFYLPMDGSRVAKKFLDIVHPSLVIFVKYDLWYYYLKKMKYREIPLLLISALFQKDLYFFKWYGVLQRKMLSRFDHLFVQNEESKKLMEGIGLGNKCSISGDTRFDRVIEIAEKFEPIPEIEKFIGNSKAMIAGSTWKEDEEVLQNIIKHKNEISLKLIIAPHEVNEKNIDSIKELFPDAVLFTCLKNNPQPSSNILIIDNIGMLSRLYKYAYISYVGGGLTKNGVHNVLEAAVYGKPVLFGPVYRKYHEAIELLHSGGGISFNNAEELKEKILLLLNNEQQYIKVSLAAKNYVLNNKGATQKIIGYIQEKRLLTN